MYLGFSAAEHADDAEADRLHREGRRPGVAQYRQTNKAVAVYVRMQWNVWTDKLNL